MLLSTVCLFITVGFSNTILMKCKPETKQQSITVTSSSFSESGMIPSKYTCDGVNVSPPLAWTKGPDSTKSYVLICDDPDAPSRTWLHWVLYNIPSSTTSLPENVPATETVLSTALNGTNDFKTLGYGGPCPPSGVPRYFFKIFALDCLLNLKAGATADTVTNQMKNHVLATGTLIGKYQRK